MDDFDQLLRRLHELAEEPGADPAEVVDLMLSMLEGYRSTLDTEPSEHEAEIIPLFPSERRTHKSARRA